MSERQQLAEAILPWLRTTESGRWNDRAMHEVAEVVEPFLVAAERAGYERCKRDASKGIEALHRRERLPVDSAWNLGLNAALAVVAALDAGKVEH